MRSPRCTPTSTAYNAIGSTPAHASALSTAFDLVNQYVNFQNGQAPGPSLPAGYDAASNDLRGLANVIASCVNTVGGTYNDSSPCGNLYFQSYPGSGAVPTDVLTALLYIRNNPTRNVSTIYNLAPPTSPFAPVNGSVPPDFTFPILPQPGTPIFSPAAGAYASAQTVTITDSDATAALYYTTDGTTPTTNSTLYTGPVGVTTAETLKAIAVESGRVFSAVGSATYSGTLTLVTPTISLSDVTSPQGSTTPVAITATGNDDGSVVSFSTLQPGVGTFSPTTCTISGGTCSVNYVPNGTTLVGSYSGQLQASFAAAGIYAARYPHSTLIITAPPVYTLNVLYAFDDNYDGGNPTANLAQGRDGRFYGAAPGDTSAPGGSRLCSRFCR